MRSCYISKPLVLTNSRNKKVRVGTIDYVIVKNCTYKDFKEQFPADLDTRIQNYLKPISRTKSIDFIYIFKMKIRKQYRGKGYGSQVLNQLKNNVKKHTIFGLEVAPLADGRSSDLSVLKAFYKRNGFKLFKDVSSDIMAVQIIKKAK